MAIIDNRCRFDDGWAVGRILAGSLNGWGMANKSRPRPGRDEWQAMMMEVQRRLKATGVESVRAPPAIIRFRHSLTLETDRGCALAASARLEESLGELLKKVFVQDSGTQKRVFEGTGPCAAFSARIDIAFLQGLIGKSTVRNLHLIRKIRNQFAHDSEELSFDTPEVAARCGELTGYQYLDEETPSSRLRFIRVVLGLLGEVDFLGTVVPSASSPKDIGLTRIPVPPELSRTIEDVLRERGHV